MLLHERPSRELTDNLGADQVVARCDPGGDREGEVSAVVLRQHVSSSAEFQRYLCVRSKPLWTE